MVKHPRIVAVPQRPWGPNIRFEMSKLNLKAAGFGSPVEWHQDWAFLPPYRWQESQMLMRLVRAWWHRLEQEDQRTDGASRLEGAKPEGISA